MVCLPAEAGLRPGTLGVSFISTHDDYQNQGIAKKLVQALFEYARSLRKPISNSSYVPRGRAYLRHVMQRTSREFADVPLIERD
jgi:GNAT superfamily N-acetyltransferase